MGPARALLILARPSPEAGVNLLQRNLDALRARSPDLATRIESWRTTEDVCHQAAHSGAATLRVCGRLEASAEDPEAEGGDHVARFMAAAEAAGATRLVIFGLGVHTLRYLDRFEGPVLVVEPSVDLCRAVLERVDLSDALSRVDLVVTEAPELVLAHPTFTSGDRGVLVFHPTARRRAPDLFERLCRQFHPGGTPERLRITVVPPLYGGSLPVALACTRALRQIGHEVNEIDLEPFRPAYAAVWELSGVVAPHHSRVVAARLVRVIGELVLALIDEHEPDVVFALAQAPLDPPIVDEIRRSGVATAFWFCEDFRVMPYWRDLLPH
jgi:spore maturation protein CgeB